MIMWTEFQPMLVCMDFWRHISPPMCINIPTCTRIYRFKNVNSTNIYNICIKRINNNCKIIPTLTSCSRPIRTIIHDIWCISYHGKIISRIIWSKNSLKRTCRSNNIHTVWIISRNTNYISSGISWKPRSNFWKWITTISWLINTRNIWCTALSHRIYNRWISWMIDYIFKILSNGSNVPICPCISSFIDPRICCCQ